MNLKAIYNTNKMSIILFNTRINSDVILYITYYFIYIKNINKILFMSVLMESVMFS